MKLHCHTKFNISVLVIQAIDNNSSSFHGNTDVNINSLLEGSLEVF